MGSYLQALVFWGVDARTHKGSLKTLKGPVAQDVRELLEGIQAVFQDICDKTGEPGHSKIVDKETRELLDLGVVDLRNHLELIHMVFAQEAHDGPLESLRQRIEMIPSTKLLSAQSEVLPCSWFNVFELTTKQWPPVPNDNHSTLRKARAEIIEIGSTVWWKDPERPFLHECRVMATFKSEAGGDLPIRCNIWVPGYIPKAGVDCGNYCYIEEQKEDGTIMSVGMSKLSALDATQVGAESSSM